MSTGISLAKYMSNMFRGRLTLLQGITEIYKPPVIKHKNKLVELIKVEEDPLAPTSLTNIYNLDKSERASKTELARKMKVLKGFYTLEMAPPNAMEMQKLVDDLKLTQDFFKTRAMMHLTVKQAWLLFLVGLEVLLWFFIGESIGKSRIVGYTV